MRLFTHILSLIIIIVFCGNSPAQPGKSNRKALIQSLKELKQALTDQDIEKISGVFSFPIPESAMSELNIIDLIADPQESPITKEAFLKYFTRSRQCENLGIIFKHLRLDSLATGDEVEYIDKDKKYACYTAYILKIDGEVISLQYVNGNNGDYVNPTPSKVEEKVDASLCEYLVAWKFRFDGRKLHFVKMEVEG
jgi:hypothetical protein